VAVFGEAGVRVKDFPVRLAQNNTLAAVVWENKVPSCKLQMTPAQKSQLAPGMAFNWKVQPIGVSLE
jgi:hypothetical protein